MAKVGRPSKRKTGYTGVNKKILSSSGQPNPFVSIIWNSGKRIVLGQFKSAKQAAIVRDVYIISNNLNIPLQVLKPKQ